MRPDCYPEPEPADDPEIEALAMIVEAMRPLDPDAQARVARWTFARYEEAN
jgi:hypothetical protein